MDEARSLKVRDAIGILWLGRLIVPFVAERAHRHGNRPAAGASRVDEGPALRSACLGLGSGMSLLRDLPRVHRRLKPTLRQGCRGVKG